MNIEHVHSITQMFTDATFAYGVHDFVTRHQPNAENNTILQYLYTHEGLNIICFSFSAHDIFTLRVIILNLS